MNLRTAFSLAAILALAACAAPQTQPAAPQQQPERLSDDIMADNRVLIIFHNTATGNRPLLAAVRQYGAELVYRYETLSGIAIRVPPGKNMQQAVEYFSRVPGVLQVSRDQVVHLH